MSTNEMLEELLEHLEYWFKDWNVACEFWNKPCKFFSGKSPCDAWFECPESVLVLLKYYPAFKEI